MIVLITGTIVWIAALYTLRQVRKDIRIANRIWRETDEQFDRIDAMIRKADEND